MMINMKKRATAILLTLAVAVSMMEMAVLDSFALGQDEAPVTAEQYTEDANATDEINADESVNNSQAAEPDQNVTDPENSDTKDDVALNSHEEPESVLSIHAMEEPETSPAQIATLTVNVERNDNRVIEVSWEETEGAEYYTVALDEEEPVRIEDTAYCFEKVNPKVKHDITVTAYRTEGEESDTADILLAEGRVTGIEALVTADTTRQSISGAARAPQKQDVNLKTMLGEKHNGYSVVQGGCTDGTYAYYLMVSSYTQKGRILKTRISDNAVMAKSDIIDICHGNGMALDTLRNRLVIIGRDDRRNQITLVDVGEDPTDKPELIGYKKANYTYSSNWTSSKSTFDEYGLGAIAYVEKYDCYIALQRKTHELLVLNPDFKVIATIGTVITAKYPGTYQAMDADEKFVYLTLSYYNDKQPNNMILVLDWHGEKLVDVANGKAEYVKKLYKCGTDGTPYTTIKTNTPYEAENIYHIDNGDGTADFYLSEYYNNPVYKTVTKTKSYKVKWKKVKKKVKWKKVRKKVKWKKVKTKSGKTKWKYKTKRVWKYKTKKVWKYKTKYKTYTEKQRDYYNRDNYIYYLGRF